MSRSTEKPATELLVDFARAINAIDWSEVRRAAIEHYNQQMGEINRDKPRT